MNQFVQQMNDIADGWFRFCAAGIVQGGAWLLAALVLWRLIRDRASARLGYWLFALVMLKLVCPLEIIVPRNWFGFAASGASAATDEDHAPISSGQMDDDVIRTSNHRSMAPNTKPPVAALRSQQPQTEQVTVALSPHELTSAPAVRRTASTQPEPLTQQKRVASTSKQSSQTVGLSSRAVAMIVWAVAVALGMLRLAWIERRTLRLVRSARPVNHAALKEEFEALRKKCGVTPRAQLLHTSQLSSPVAACAVRPRIILPSGLLAVLSAKQRQWTLLHELAHVRRGDLWAAAFQSVLQTIYFFNPVVWIAGRMLNQLREYACDDEAATLSDIDRAESGRGFLTIVEFANQINRSPLAVNAVGIHRHHAQMRSRMMRLIQRDARRTGRLTWPVKLALAALATVMLPTVHAQEEGEAASVRARIAALQAELELLQKQAASKEKGDDSAVMMAKDKTAIHWNGAIVAPGLGQQSYVVREIDTSKLSEKGFLKFRIEMGDGESGASFDLFPANVEIPSSPEEQERVRQESSVAARYDVKPGTKAEFVHPFKKGEKFKLAATGDWESKEGSRNDFRISVFPVDEEDARSAIVGEVTVLAGQGLRVQVPALTAVTSPEGVTAQLPGVEGDITVSRVVRSDDGMVLLADGNGVRRIYTPHVSPEGDVAVATTSSDGSSRLVASAETPYVRSARSFTVSAPGAILQEEEVEVVAPDSGEQAYRMQEIDVSESKGIGLLMIQATMGDGASSGSFDLFPSDVEVPESGEAQEQLRQRKALASLYDLPPGRSGTIIYPFTGGQKFKLGVTGSWGNKVGASNSVEIKISVSKFSSQVSVEGESAVPSSVFTPIQSE